jgi:hypothetical protein
MTQNKVIMKLRIDAERKAVKAGITVHLRLIS